MDGHANVRDLHHDRGQCHEVHQLDVEFVLPAYNEEDELAWSVLTLTGWLRVHANYRWQVTIADNASTDGTLGIARRLSRDDPARVVVVHLSEKGRGRALRQVWASSRARVVAYMDVDLSCDLSAIEPLVRPLLDGRADVSCGSRLLPQSKVTRCLKREIISRCYNHLLRRSFRGNGYAVRDAQCGFKAMRGEVARVLMPCVTDNDWFFDTELLVAASAAGLVIDQFPVTWREDPGTTVDVMRTVREDLEGIRRMHAKLRAGTLPLGSIAAASDMRQVMVGEQWAVEEHPMAGGRPTASGRLVAGATPPRRRTYVSAGVRTGMTNGAEATAR